MHVQTDVQHTAWGGEQDVGVGERPAGPGLAFWSPVFKSRVV
jgi:hypothetical protein